SRRDPGGRGVTCPDRLEPPPALETRQRDEETARALGGAEVGFTRRISAPLQRSTSPAPHVSLSGVSPEGQEVQPQSARRGVDSCRPDERFPASPPGLLEANARSALLVVVRRVGPS